MYHCRLFNVSRFAQVVARKCATSTESQVLKGSKAVLTGDRGINKVTLIGRVGRDSEVRGSDINPVTVFPLATSITLKSESGEYVQKTEWHRISVFRRGMREMAAQNIKKGDRVYVSGSINYSSYVTVKSNNQQRVANIIAEDVIRLGGASKTEPVEYTAEEV